MIYNFDELINRKNTNSLKYDFAAERGKTDELIPLWIADMDFKTHPQVTDALIKSAQHSIFGYTETKEDYFETIKNWFMSRFAFEMQAGWLVKTPGVVYSVCMAIRAFTDVSDSVLIQTPVYYPFKESILFNERKVVCSSLVLSNGKYQVDFADFEEKIIRNNVKLFVLCSPHNPVGRVWTESELIKMGNICFKHNVIIVSDEIHCDFVYGGRRHCVFASLGDDFLNNSIICTSPSKTFNLAGLQISNVFIADEVKRNAFIHEIRKTGYSQLNTMGIVACQSAYKHGGDWVDELNRYLTKNLDFIREYIRLNMPRIKLIEPEGTYLIWLDFRELFLSEKELDSLIVDKAKLWVDNGIMFGDEGQGFVRINIACPIETIKRAMEQLYSAICVKNSIR